jgi:regulation of enolase protein 1 (concanavalin A-like superfamily)
MDREGRRLRRRKVICFIASLSLVVGALTASLLVPPRLLTETEEGEERGETYGADGVRYRLTRLEDRFGRMPDDPYSHARTQVDLLHWSGASKRIELAPAVSINPQMFSSTASADAASLVDPNLSPKRWRWLGPGNIGGRIRAIAISPANPDIMFAGSVGGGIWKTANGGASWSPVDDFMAVLSVSTIVINPVTPNVMYAGTGEGYGNGDSIRGAGIFKSTDGGTTWSQLPGTANAFWAVNRLAISPDGRTVLAVGSSGTYRSADGSAFTRVSSGIAAQDVDFSPIDSSKAIAVGWGAIAYSWDGGRTWQKAAGLPLTGGRIEAAYARSQPDIVYAAIDRNGGVLYRSINGGATFAPVYTTGNLMDNQGWYDTAIWVSPVDSNHLFVGGVWMRESRDGGATWQKFAGYIYGDNHVIVSDPRYDGVGNRRLFFGNDGGVWRADDIFAVTAGTVRSLNNNLGVTQFYGGAGNVSSGTIVGGTQDHGSIVWSPRAGASWKQTLGSDGGFVASDPADASYFYAESIYLGLVRSTDGGSTWTGIAAGLKDAGRSANFIAPFILDPNNPSRMLAGGASLWRSDNVKAPAPEWKAIQGGSGNYVSAIAVAPGNSDVLWIGRSWGRVFKSTNATSASPAFTALKAPTKGVVTRITISPADWNVVYVTTGSFGPTNVLKTTDGGVTWMDATGSGMSGLPDAPVNDLDIDPANPEIVYAATEVGVFQSGDGGAHWELPQDGPANVCVDEMFWMGSTLVALTHGRGAFAIETARTGTPAVTLTPASLDFGSRSTGTNASRTVTVTNTGDAPVTIYTVGREGPHASSFEIVSTTCVNVTLGSNASCTADIRFGPRTSGAMSATLWVYSNAPRSPHAMVLTGAGAPPSDAPLAPWTSQDVGLVGVAGSASASNDILSVKGAGADIWGAADAFQFVYQPLQGDGAIVTRVKTVQAARAWTKAGVMIRETLDAGSPHASLFVTPGKGIAFQSRAIAGVTSVGVGTAGAAPAWVKLVRAGSILTGSMSADGVSWTKVGEATIAMTANVYAGLAVSSHNASQAAMATFSDAGILGPPSLAEGWQNADVGATGLKGTFTVAAGATDTLRTFTVSGSGADIWGTADAFHYVYRALNGDGELVARVASVRNTHRWAKAGLMIRADNSASAPYAMMLVSAAAGSAFQYRKNAGGFSESVSGGSAIRSPYWIKITRGGDAMTGYQSPDGSHWTEVGSVTIPAASSVSIGLAVSSHIDAPRTPRTQLSKGTFDVVVGPTRPSSRPRGGSSSVARIAR